MLTANSANWFIASTGQVDVNVAWRVMECPHLNGSVLDCLRNIVTVLDVCWMSDHEKLAEVNSLALRNP